MEKSNGVGLLVNHKKPAERCRAPSEVANCGCFAARGADVSFASAHGYLDIVAAPAGIRDYADLHRDAERVEIAEGITATVASLRDVIRSKLAAGRDRDNAKLPALKALAELS